MFGGEGAEESGEVERFEPVNGAGANGAAFDACELIEFGASGVQFREDAMGSAEQQRASLGGLPGGAVDEGDAEFGFEAFDLLGDGGLDDVEFGGGGGEPAGTDDGFEV